MRWAPICESACSHSASLRPSSVTRKYSFVLTRSIEAFLGEGCREMRELFLKEYGLSEAEVPLLAFDPTRADPFVLLS